MENLGPQNAAPEEDVSSGEHRNDLRAIIASYDEVRQKAVSTFQDALAEFIKPVWDIKSALVSFVEPFEEFTTKLAAELQMPVRSADLLRILSEAWKQTIEAAVQESDLEIREALEAAAQLGSLGSTLPTDVTLLDLRRMAQIKLPAEIDDYFKKHYEMAGSANLDDFQRKLERLDVLLDFRPVLNQCFGAYRRHEYAITIPALISILERAIRNLGPKEALFSTRFKDMVNRQFEISKKGDPEAIEVYIWMSLRTFVEWFYTDYRESQAKESRLFRHGIQHGTQAPPDEQIESLRLLHALSTVAALYEWQSE